MTARHGEQAYLCHFAVIGKSTVRPDETVGASPVLGILPAQGRSTLEGGTDARAGRAKETTDR